jgi:hypothetical protein
MRTRARALLLFVVVGAAFFRPTESVDSITQAASISGNQTLVSAGGVFQLGFFVPPGADDGRTYLGIWYANIPGPTVVWVANRQSPLVDSPGVLRLTADGRLVILDRQNATVWSSAAAPTTRNVAAQLRDNGNFVLITDGSVAWQSFDYPSDTLLPGMKLGVDVRAGITRNITSWNTPSDPSPGAYTFKLVLGGMPEFFLVRGGTAETYGSGPFNGDMLTGAPYLRSSNDFTFKVVSTPDETYYSYAIADASLLSRFVVNGTAGRVQRYVWINAAWSTFWYYPNDPCDSYAVCGAFGYCDTGDSPMCTCLPGFQPRWPQQWNLHDGAAGCVRTAGLSCAGGGSDDGFWVVNRMKLPEATNATLHAAFNLDQCRQACLTDCSCRAYAAANVSGGLSRGCVIWDVDLLDMRQYSTVVQDVYIRLARSEIDALNAAAGSNFDSNFSFNFSVNSAVHTEHLPFRQM